MENREFNWCFIGAGTLAGKVAKEITKSGRHRIASVYTRREEICREFAKQYGASPCQTAAEAISIPEVNGVYVVTPHNSHYEYVKLALELGKPVLCEKPFTVDASQTEELINLAREKGVYLAEAMWTWFGPVANQVKTWLDTGEFGTIRKVVANYHMNSQSYAPRVTVPNRAGGALLDVGVYPITYLYRLFGNPTEVRCTGKLEGGIDLGEDVEMTFPGGQTFTASASIVDFKGLEKLKLVGEKASISIRFFHNANAVTLKRSNGKHETFRGDGSYLNEFDRVAEEIRAGRTESNFVPLEATLDVMKIMDQCRRQMGLVYPFEKLPRQEWLDIRGAHSNP